MSTQEIFHINNQIRLLKMANTPRQYKSMILMVRLPKIQTDLNDKQFSKTINQTTTYYGKDNF